LAYRELFLAYFDQSLLSEIRTAVNKGMALESDRFKQDVERLTGRRVTSLKPGPKLKNV
jgi:putative transposase